MIKKSPPSSLSASRLFLVAIQHYWHWSVGVYLGLYQLNDDFCRGSGDDEDDRDDDDCDC